MDRHLLVTGFPGTIRHLSKLLRYRSYFKSKSKHFLIFNVCKKKEDTKQSLKLTIMNVIQFLKKHNVYQKALQYNKKSYGFESDKKAVEYFEYYEDSPTLRGFFDFHRTDEGKDFWLNMDIKFKNLKKKNNHEEFAY